jgi:MoxR-like ATPase
MLIGVPGLAKTLLVETFGQVLGLSSKRIQCTPDLMPSDIIGTEILDQTGKTSAFRFIEGPVFTNLLMADEINRASPRTQSALLQAMQERSVSVAGDTKGLPHPFHVLATRNPLEQEGTYPLPEAQLDRFIMQIHIGYPDEATEAQILTQTTGGEKLVAEMRMSHDDFETAQAAIRNLPVGEDFVARVVRIIRQARPETTSLDKVKEFVNWAPGPRAGQSLIMAAKAHAMINGRMTPDSSDIEKLAFSVLNHRMALNYSARSHNIHLDELINEILESAA